MLITSDDNSKLLGRKQENKSVTSNNITINKDLDNSLIGGNVNLNSIDMFSFRTKVFNDLANSFKENDSISKNLQL